MKTSKPEVRSKSKCNPDKPHLFRVDLTLKYLFLTYRDDYGTQADILNWLQSQMHEGELDWVDDEPSLTCTEVSNAEEINDFDESYNPYSSEDDPDLQERSLEDLIPELNLDSAEMIRVLKSRGYEVKKK